MTVFLQTFAKTIHESSNSSREVGSVLAKPPAFISPLSYKSRVVLSLLWRYATGVLQGGGSGTLWPFYNQTVWTQNDLRECMQIDLEQIAYFSEKKMQRHNRGQKGPLVMQQFSFYCPQYLDTVWSLFFPGSTSYLAYSWQADHTARLRQWGNRCSFQAADTWALQSNVPLHDNFL